MCRIPWFATLPLLICTLVFAACSNEHSDTFQGYAEGEFVHVSSPLGGILQALSVTRGQTVTAGHPLFALEHDFETAAREEAAHNLQRAQDRLADLKKGQRPSELDAIRARLGQARHSASLAEKEYRRRITLLEEQTISQEELDRTKSDYEQKNEQVRQIRAELQTAQLGARTDEIRAAEAEVRQAEAKLEQAEWNLNQKRQNTPSAGLIFDTLYRVGEWVPAGRPIVSLLPPQNIEARFFVPQDLAGKLAVGDEALISFDGTPEPVPARIYYISPSAEYTPPVIYSSQSRAKLVFLIKARPEADKATLLHPGQPVDVTIPELAD
ncbi:HlyD family secretion protein [Pseudodesulfovibrio tunisiensis]|uniref:HlyD family secretion protein n=1 Tax=Pseudodesulfovibrio tunisiensis TaxID=463192 RepID=UPI001FB4D15C|nr:HlyD family efflux transporter periplasmic adaptor subunit [Pseudodesulfovibrio tunisiensis]